MDEVEIVIDAGSRRSDCFGILKESLLGKLIGNGNNALPSSSVVPLELRSLSQANRSTAATTTAKVIVIAAVSDVYAKTNLAGCSNRPLQIKSGQIAITPSFATDLGLVEGDVLTCSFAGRTCPVATAVVVAPATVDDSEVVELNALRIEATLLQYLRIVFVGLRATIPVHEGVTASIVVESISVSPNGGASLSPSPTIRSAIMTDGTELHVATRSRASHSSAADGAASAPRPATLRMRSSSVAHVEQVTSHEGCYVSPVTAQALGWVNGISVGVLHCASICAMLDTASVTPIVKKDDTSTILEPSAIRAHACRVTVNISDAASHLEDGCLYFPPSEAAAAWGRSGNVLVTPNPPSNIAASLKEWFQLLADLPGNWPTSAYCKSVHDLRHVHGDIAVTLSNLVDPGVAVTRPNILVCGAKGTGKSTLAVSAACSSGKLFVRYLACHETETKNFTKQLSTLTAMCLLNGPSVLILDGLENVAPSQAEGHVNAVSEATQSILESCLRLPQLPDILTTFGLRNLFDNGKSHQHQVQCVAVASHRDMLHESVRTARHIAHILPLEASLGGEQRMVMMQQTLRYLGIPEDFVRGEESMFANPMVKRAVTLRTENFVAFDMETFSRRLACRLRTNAKRRGLLNLKELTQQDVMSSLDETVSTFESLAHQGAGFVKRNDVSKDERPSWDDVGGLSEVKKVLHDTLILPSKMPKLFEKLPLKSRSGVLLFGPSGCGKTHAIQTIVAAEQLNCIVVNGPEIFGKYIGQSEQKVREIFERAQSAAPSVVFFDEFDSVAPQRGNDNTGVTDRVVNQLLCYLDGVEARTNVFVVAASSRPDLIDAALLRPGRLDQAVYCPMPDLDSRCEILRAHLRKVPHCVQEEALRDLASRTHGWTSADLAALVATAHMTETQKTVDLSRDLERLGVGDAAGHPTAASAASFTIARATGDISKLEESWSIRTADRNVQPNQMDSKTNHSQATGSASPRATPQVTAESLEVALTKSRRSMSDRDIARQEALYRNFINSREPGGSHEPLVKPGTRTTMA